MGPRFIDSSFCLLRWERQGALVVAYISKAMEELTGYSLEECLGQRYGEHFGSLGMVRHGIDLSMLADGSSVTPEDITEGILHLSNSFSRLEQMLSSCSASGSTLALAESLTFTLDLLQRKGGRVFVCEQVLIVQKHTLLGWPYTVAILRDITGAVSVNSALCAAARGELPGLVRNRDGDVCRWLLDLSVETDEALAFLDGLVLRWLRPFEESHRPFARAPRPLASVASQQLHLREDGEGDAARVTSICATHSTPASFGRSRRLTGRDGGGRRRHGRSGALG